MPSLACWPTVMPSGMTTWARKASSKVSIPLSTYGAFTPGAAGTLLVLSGSLYNTFAAGVTAGTIPAKIITGAMTCYLNSAATTPGNQTTRSAALLLQDLLQEFGLGGLAVLPANFAWEIIITQTGAGTLTLVGGTGVTVTGTATVAQNTTRTFVGQFTGSQNAPTFTLTSVGTGSYS